MAVSCLIAKAHLRPPEVGDRGTDGEEEGSGRAGSTLSDADDGYVRLPMLVNYFLSLIFSLPVSLPSPSPFLSIFPVIAPPSPLLLLVLHSSFSKPFHPFVLPNHLDLKGIDLLICTFIKQDLSMNGPLGGFP